MKTKVLLFLCVLFAFGITACKDDEETGTDDNTNVDNSPKEEIIEITTKHGRMLMWLFKETPKHRENFLKLSNEGFYDSTEFHRVVKNFVIQGGDPNSKDDNRGNDGSGGPGYTIEAEIDSTILKHDYGAVGAARLGDGPNPQRASSGSQFYIVVNPDGTPHLDGAYTVFGKIIDGMDVADKISTVGVNMQSLPNIRLPMQIEVLTYSHNQLKDSFNFTP